MLAVQEQALRSGELINVHPKMRGEALGIPFRQIDKTGLMATSAAAQATESIHEGKERRMKEDVKPEFQLFAILHPISAILLVMLYFESCCSTKSPTTGSL